MLPTKSTSNKKYIYKKKKQKNGPELIKHVELEHHGGIKKKWFSREFSSF